MRQVGLHIALIATLLTTGLNARAEGVNSSDQSEYLIKAGFIYNFAKLVEWPASSFASPAHPIVVGIFGNDAFATVLERVVDGKKIGLRPFVVKRLVRASELKDSNNHILFIASQESARADEVVQLVKGASVLTIADAPGLAKRGVIIDLTLEDSKVGFEVNVDTAKQAGLTISSRLLSLAKIVSSR